MLKEPKPREVYVVSLEQASKNLLRHMQRSLCEGDGWFPEADEGLNNASRALVQAVADEHGGAWLCLLNGYREPGWQPVWRWDGGLVYNFGASAVMPRYDAEVERLIRERAAGPYTTTTADAEKVEAIYAAITAAGGHSLLWS